MLNVRVVVITVNVHITFVRFILCKHRRIINYLFKYACILYLMIDLNKINLRDAPVVNYFVGVPVYELNENIRLLDITSKPYLRLSGEIRGMGLTHLILTYDQYVDALVEKLLISVYFKIEFSRDEWMYAADTCVICKKPCKKIVRGLKDYCARCLPQKYRTKPIHEWVCDLCQSHYGYILANRSFSDD